MGSLSHAIARWLLAEIKNYRNMKKEKKFLASADIAKRIGVAETRYRTPEGRYVLDEKDIRMLRFQMTPDEYVNGIDATIIPDNKLQAIIATCKIGVEEQVKEEVEQNKEKEE